MNDRLPFNPLQAQEVAQAFNAAGVDYLFIGKGGAILLSFPGTTQDVDVFPAKSVENGQRIVAALLLLGFSLDENAQSEIVRGKAFVQLTDGPFSRLRPRWHRKLRRGQSQSRAGRHLPRRQPA